MFKVYTFLSLRQAQRSRGAGSARTGPRRGLRVCRAAAGERGKGDGADPCDFRRHGRSSCRISSCSRCCRRAGRTSMACSCWGVSVFDTPLLGVDGWLKRVEDLAIGIVAVIVTAPLMLAIAAAVGRGFGAPSTPGSTIRLFGAVNARYAARYHRRRAPYAARHHRRRARL